MKTLDTSKPLDFSRPIEQSDNYLDTSKPIDFSRPEEVKMWRKKFWVTPEGGTEFEFELEVPEGDREYHLMSEAFVRYLFKKGIKQFTYNHPNWGLGTKGEIVPKFVKMQNDGPELWVDFLINGISHNYCSVGKITIY